MMRSYTSHVRLQVDVVGREETKSTLTGLMGDIGALTSLVTSADYAFSSWQRAIEKFDIFNLARAIMSTISLLHNLIRVTELATLAQLAYNAALKIGLLLSGPYGWAIGGAAILTGIGITAVAQSLAPGPEPDVFVYSRFIEEERRREQYRGTEGE